MNPDNTTTTSAPGAENATTEVKNAAENAAAENATKTKNVRTHRFARPGAIAAAILTLIAWGTLILSEWVSLAFCLLAITAAIFGCLQPRSNSRNLAITALIASGVLLLDIIILLSAIAFLSSM